MLIFTWHHRQTSAWQTFLSCNIKLQQANHRSQMWCSFNLICKNAFFWQCYFANFLVLLSTDLAQACNSQMTHTLFWYWKGIIVSVLINFFPLLKIKEVTVSHLFFFLISRKHCFYLRKKYWFSLKYIIKDSLMQTADTETSHYSSLSLAVIKKCS